MKRIKSLTQLVLVILFTNLFGENIPIKITSLPDQVERYQSISSQLEVFQEITNPYNPDEIQIEAILETPSQKELIVPCFYFKPGENISFWQFRYTPTEIGTYQIYFAINSKGQNQKTKSFSFKVTPSSRPGFIRMNPTSYSTFRFDSGKPLRLIGENVCWADNYEYFFKKLQENGLNFARIWMCPWNFPLEWKATGVGRYNSPAAEGLDRLFQLAEQYGIYLMLCIDYHGVIQRSRGYFQENRWLENPYNAKNGGPCEKPEEFFTNPAAKKYYQNRLRYLVGRFAYHPNLLAWEFWNEVDLTAGKRDEVVQWHAEMAKFLRQLDPQQHLITTSFSGTGYPEIWEIPELDFSQTHHYNVPDMTETFSTIITRHEMNYHKPHVIGEFGVDYRGAKETSENDPQNIGLHNGLWAGFFLPTPIIPATWWWDNLIDPDNLYFHFNALTNYAHDFLNNGGKIKPIDPSPRIVKDITAADSSKDLTLWPFKPWGKNSIQNFLIQSDGQINHKEEIPAYLYGLKKPELRQPPTFEVEYRDAGQFAVHVGQVSDSGCLRIYLDEKLALEKSLPLGNGKGEWERSVWQKEHKLFQGSYHKTWSIPVPAGKHKIRVENAGSDWIQITYYKFENCHIRNFADIRCLGLQNSTDYFLWLRHQDYTWKKAKQANPHPAENFVLVLEKIFPGTYRLEWWDGYEGKILDTKSVTVDSDERISIKIPALSRDLACKLLKIK